MNLKEKIIELISLKYEGEYWDYKQEWHKNIVALLHDILCLSNSVYRGDCYLIYGVNDQGNIIGLKNDKNRRTQAELIDFFRKIKFAGGNRPIIELKTFIIYCLEIDILIIKHSDNTPFYLKEDKKKQGKSVRGNHIYSRIGDTNTPIDSSADIGIVEKLWKRRFGIELSPLERLNILLNDYKDWEKDLGNKNFLHHKKFPEFRIEYGELKEGYETFSAFYLNPSSYFGSLKFYYYSTIIYESEIWTGDEQRVFLPKAKIGSLSINSKERYWYYYYDLASIEGKLLKIFTSKDYDYSSRFERKVQFLLFRNELELNDFENYAKNNNEYFEVLKCDEIDQKIKIHKQNGNRNFSPEHIIKTYNMYTKWGKGVLKD